MSFPQITERFPIFRVLAFLPSQVKKLIKSLEAARGNGTSMISLIIPPGDQACVSISTFENKIDSIKIAISYPNIHCADLPSIQDVGWRVWNSLQHQIQSQQVPLWIYKDFQVTCFHHSLREDAKLRFLWPNILGCLCWVPSHQYNTGSNSTPRFD